MSQPPPSAAPKAVSAEGLAASAQKFANKGPAPVHLWNPPFCGDIDMRIARDGTWFYLGTPIGRPAMVKLFSSILKKEQGRYFLVTPVEKVGIQVDDAPFLAQDFTVKDGVITFTTQVGDCAAAGPDHPIRVAYDRDTQEPSPYVLIRSNLEALIDRKSFYRLVDIGEYDTYELDMWFGVRSNGVFFPIIKADKLSQSP